MLSPVVSQLAISLLVLLHFSRKTAISILSILGRWIYKYRYWLIRIVLTGLIIAAGTAASIISIDRWSWYSYEIASSSWIGFMEGLLIIVFLIHLIKSTFKIKDDYVVLAIILWVLGLTMISDDIFSSEPMQSKDLARFLGKVLGAVISLHTMKLSQVITKTIQFERLEREDK